MANEKDLESKWDVQLRKGTLDLVVLAALNGRTLYGLELLQLLHKFETTRITEGTLYPLLDRLKRDGLVTAQWRQEGETRPRKYYALTELGSNKLSAVSRRWQQAVSDINHLLAHPGPAPLNDEE
ncbi:PadR family transcriptional regulator [Alteromonas sediminis]|uniref:PadR family transcriptional regulator n=1 Tax=Alteromonas sediminis TaxID=2259342 RepID=A0A3N5Y2Z4_9ALTE|nr:PadR family transcriptional regulator [Alteromonas sediminis]RPJ68192.1 PadR family transcriptional regulator [Alteromonas sediminis]